MIRRFLYNFMQGRNGFDDLTKFVWILTIVFLFLSFLPGIFGFVCSFIVFALIIYTWWRVCSRNVYKRSQENARYLARTAALRTKLRDSRVRFSMRKEYKFFTCPTCHTRLRVPRGKGKLQITCSKCGNRFSGKT